MIWLLSVILSEISVWKLKITKLKKILKRCGSLEVDFPYLPLLYLECSSPAEFYMWCIITIFVISICVCMTNACSRTTVLICFVINVQISTTSKQWTISIILINSNTVLFILSDSKFIIVCQWKNKMIFWIFSWRNLMIRCIFVPSKWSESTNYLVMLILDYC